MASNYDRVREDVSNIVHLEHVNVTVPDQRLATAFYVAALGFTRDPYIMVGTDNMWINIGRSQMHLPTGGPQRMRGTIGLVVPDLDELKERLGRTASALEGTQFSWADRGAFVESTCPWGNRFRCHAPSAEFGDTELAMPYVEFDVPTGSADGIARFYAEVIGATTETTKRDGAPAASVSVGRDQRIIFRYSTRSGEITPDANPNGSLDNIAGICSPGRNVLGMMPHPERSSEPELGGTEGFKIFESLVGAMAEK